MNAPVDFKAMEGMFEREYKQIEVGFDPEEAVAWTYMKPSGAPCFSFGMLEELRAAAPGLQGSSLCRSGRANAG